jgi:hypothetical protein
MMSQAKASSSRAAPAVAAPAVAAPAVAAPAADPSAPAVAPPSAAALAAALAAASAASAAVARKREAPYVLLKAKTPQEVAGMEKYRAGVRKATDIPALLTLTVEFALIDKAQSSFALNRMKKACEEWGYFDELTFLRRGFGVMGTRLKEQLFSIMRQLPADKIPAVKAALLNEAVFRDRPKVSKMKTERMPAIDAPETADEIQFLTMIDAATTETPKRKKRKTKAPKAVADRGICSSSSSSSSSSSNAKSSETPSTTTTTTTPATLTATTNSTNVELQIETAKSIKATRLADAISHASFAHLTKAQQQLIRAEWISLLV